MSALSDFIFKDNIKSIQSFQTTVPGGQTTFDVTISPVDINKTIIIPTGRRGRSVYTPSMEATGPYHDNGPADATIRLTSSTNVRIERATGATNGISGQNVSMIYAYQVVEFG